MAGRVCQRCTFTILLNGLECVMATPSTSENPDPSGPSDIIKSLSWFAKRTQAATSSTGSFKEEL